MRKSPAFIELRRIEAAREIANLLSNSRNKVYLDAETLLLNLTNKLDENLEKGSVSTLGKFKEQETEKIENVK